MINNTDTVKIIKKCKILGVNVSVTSIQQTLDLLVANLNSLRGKYICVSNVHTIVMSYDDKDYKSIQNDGYMVLPDGKPLSVVSRFRGHREAKRVTGPDLMGHIFQISRKKKYRHYFYGSTNETLAALRIELKADYPDLEIAGMYSPPFRELTVKEDNEAVDVINRTKPDFVWVGLGAPKQEIWMHDHQNKINGLMIGVGAGFDFYAKNIKRAPQWMQRLSLEWLYRLLQDPQRLWKRYLFYNTRFIFLVIKEFLIQPDKTQGNMSA